MRVEIITNAGQSFDMREGGISLSFYSGLLNFSEIGKSRSVSFDLPLTAKNKKLLADNQSIYNYDGQRRKIEGTLYLDGTLMMAGALYVISTDVEDGVANCVFMETNLWERVSQVKNIREYAIENHLFETSYLWETSAVNAWNNKQYPAKVLQYVQDTGALRPSLLVYNIISILFSNLGLRLYGLNYSRIIPKIESASFSATMVSNALGSVQPSWGHYANGGLVMDSDAGAYARFFSTLDVTHYCQYSQWRDDEWQPLGADDTRNWYHNTYLVCQNELQIKFPDTATMDDICLIAPDNTDTRHTYKFLTDRKRSLYYNFSPMQSPDSWTVQWTVSGTSLRNRTVTIPAGQPFAIVNMYSFFAEYRPSGVSDWGELYYGLYCEQNVSVSVQVTMGSRAGQYYLLQSILPTCSLLDLINTVNTIEGTRLAPYVNMTILPPRGISFSFQSYATALEDSFIFDVKEYVGVSALERTVGDLSQKNVIKYEDDKLSTSYSIDNEYLSAEGNLFSIPFLSSEQSYGNFTAKNTEGDYLCISQSGKAFLQPAKIKTDVLLQKFCSCSQKIKLALLLSPRRLEAIVSDYYCRFSFAGGLWHWLSCNYDSKGIATFTLQRVE